MRSTELTPLLFWAGGKRWAARIIGSLFEDTGSLRFVDPFCGGLGLPLKFRPEKALLCDRNEHVINVYAQVQAGLPRRLPMEIDRVSYYTRRNLFNDLIRNGGDDSPEAAELFYYLNQTGFHGICRFNRDGQYNVAFGTGKGTKFVESFEEYRLAFRGWDFYACDFHQTLTCVRDGDFVFCDPPYDASFDDYTQYPWTWKEQCALVDRLRYVTQPVVLANRATDRMIALYEEYGYTLRFFDRMHNVSAKGVSGYGRELLAFRNIADHCLKEELFTTRTKARRSA